MIHCHLFGRNGQIHKGMYVFRRRKKEGEDKDVYEVRDDKSILLSMVVTGGKGLWCIASLLVLVFSQRRADTSRTVHLLYCTVLYITFETYMAGF